MSRDRSEDCAVVGRVLEQLSFGVLTDAQRDAPTFTIRVEDQIGSHRDGRQLHCYARVCRVRPSQKMQESSVRIQVGDDVCALVPPSPGPDAVYTAIARIVTASRRAAADAPPQIRAAGMPQRRSGTHGR
jgi:hypothetical protein